MARPAARRRFATGAATLRPWRGDAQPSAKKSPSPKKAFWRRVFGSPSALLTYRFPRSLNHWLENTGGSRGTHGSQTDAPVRHPGPTGTGTVRSCARAGVLVGLDGCEVRLCDPCACVRPCVPCVSRLPPVSFYRYCDSCVYPVCVPARPRPVF